MKPFQKTGKIIAVSFIVVIIAALSVYFLPSLSRGNPSAIQAADRRQTENLPVLLPDVQKPFRILHIMSYHSPWKWTDDQFHGFQAALKDVPIEYKIIQMDTKRRSDEAWKLRITRRAKQVIKDWQPDLIYSGDDSAQASICQDYVNSDIPIVFGAVNADPADYGFTGSRNVTGILERMHYGATLKLLKKLDPRVQKVAILTDAGDMWPPMIERIKSQSSEFAGIEIVSYDMLLTFEEFKQKILDYQDTVNAVGFLGIFELKDENGQNVPMERIIEWLSENNRLPDFSFWKDRVDKGTLCAVTVSGYAQGYQAGLLARRILVDKVSPADIPVRATEKGIPVINLETAERINIRPRAEVLLTAEVIRTTKQ